MENRQVHPATSPESDETFRVCKARCADYFGKTNFQNYSIWGQNTQNFRLFLTTAAR